MKIIENREPFYPHSCFTTESQSRAIDAEQPDIVGNDMSTSQSRKKIEFNRFPVVRKYAEEIPAQLHGLLLPIDQSELETFSKRVKLMRCKLEERAYVMELQEMYDLPLRPNATVKETMIRARLKYRQERLENDGDFPEPGTDENLPVDPLE